MIFFEAFYVTGIKLINMETENTVKVLIAEDDDGHADLIIDVLQRSGVKNEILRFTDGVDLSAYLDKEGRNSGLVAGKSFLVLLDINMPRMDGVEVLQKMKADDELKNIPVITLTTTDDPREIDLCYRDWETDRKSTRLNSSHITRARMPSSA